MNFLVSDDLSMSTIRNPILQGFNPDPSITRVGEDYYIATSTFEWFPGIQIHHSRDLVHWRLLTHPLSTIRHLDMEGNPCSGGIWAPCLTYSDGLFHLVFTDVKNLYGAYKDTHNYLTTATDIMGPWSQPVYLNSSGFDPSLFHDEDGRKWLVNMQWDHRPNKNRFAGVLLQEYSPDEKRLVGPVRNIFKGTSLGVTEGPHLYRWHGYYYLVTAEGGTSYNHCVTVARSRNIEGPYEVDPSNPILTSQHHPEIPLQKAGHACVVQTQSNEWYMVHLCSRPITSHRRCVLGRETAIQKCYWTPDLWLRLEGGGNFPMVEVPGPKLSEHPWKLEPQKEDFNEQKINLHFNTLRVPVDESWVTLKERPGYLRLRGRESLRSQHCQSLVARRMQSFQCEVETCVEFEPDHFQQMAGLVCYYNVQNLCYLRISRDESLGKCLGIIIHDNDEYIEPLQNEISIQGWKRCHLKAVIKAPDMQFYYSPDGIQWNSIGPTIDVSKLSDDYVRGWGFTGAFVGMCAQDLSGTKKPADFDYFIYREL